MEDGVYRVVGKVAERAVALNDVTTDEAADYVQGRLRRFGVDRALARAGARDGDLVHIGELAFTWYRDQPEFIGEPGSPAPTDRDDTTPPVGRRDGARTVVVKIGSSSVTTAAGGPTARPSRSWPPRWPRPGTRATGWWWSARAPSPPDGPAWPRTSPGPPTWPPCRPWPRSASTC